MKLLDNESLEQTSIVANSLMNRLRGAVGVNSYERELRLNPLEFLAQSLATTGSARWLDICCGSGQALIDASRYFQSRGGNIGLLLQGVDLVDQFAEIPPGQNFLRLERASVHDWQTSHKYDLITCVHGLHYLGDKLGILEKSAPWLAPAGLFLASLDLGNLRHADGKPLGRSILKRFRQVGLQFDSRKHLLSCAGAKSFRLGYRYLGADSTAGPNYSRQDAVDSYYEPMG